MYRFGTGVMQRPSQRQDLPDTDSSLQLHILDVGYHNMLGKVCPQMSHWLEWRVDELSVRKASAQPSMIDSCLSCRGCLVQ